MRHSTVSLQRVRLLFVCSACRVYSLQIMDESKVREIVAHNNKELLSQIKDLVSSSISDLKRSSDANSAEQMSEIKRLKREAPPSFNKKSNEDQYKQPNVCLRLLRTHLVGTQRPPKDKGTPRGRYVSTKGTSEINSFG